MSSEKDDPKDDKKSGDTQLHVQRKMTCVYMWI